MVKFTYATKQLELFPEEVFSQQPSWLDGNAQKSCDTAGATQGWSLEAAPGSLFLLEKALWLQESNVYGKKFFRKQGLVRRCPHDHHPEMPLCASPPLHCLWLRTIPSQSLARWGMGGEAELLFWENKTAGQEKPQARHSLWPRQSFWWCTSGFTWAGTGSRAGKANSPATGLCSAIPWGHPSGSESFVHH